MRTPARFREDDDPGFGEDLALARMDARADARRDAQPWWPAWAKAANIARPEPEVEEGRLF